MEAYALLRARFWRFVLLALVLGGSSGCASIFRSYDVTPAGLDRGDDALRQMLASGQADTALHRLEAAKKNPGPTDDLLRTLYQGVLAYYAGLSDSSAFMLDRASLLLEDRENVLRISREAASFLSNDRALPYQPGRTERLLIPYYGALSYLRTGDLQEAAVEARRLSHALQALEDEPEGIEQQTRGMLRYFSALVFEAAGQWNDAAVAYRHAENLLDRTLVTSNATADSGDVVIVFEQGFVAHRFEESVTVILADDEADGLRHDDRHHRESTAAAVATRALEHALRPGLSYSEGPRRPKHRWHVPAPRREKREAESCTAESASTNAKSNSAQEAKQSCKDKDDDDDFYILRLAWPAYHTLRRPVDDARVFVGNAPWQESPIFLNVSDAVVNDFERERARILARTIVRAAAKLALVKSVEKSAGKKNEGLGDLVGTIANVSGAVLEQADTRSWTLLPGSIGLLRLRLPAGSYPLALELPAGVPQHSGRRLDLGTVQVLGGRTAFVTARHW